MFDWAQQPFYTLVTTFIFAPYFANVFVGDATRGQAVWGYATALAGFIVAFTSPVLGAMADASGRRRPYIWAFSIMLVAGSSLLWYAEPGATDRLLWLLAAFVVATVAAEGALVFINAMMPSLARPEELGRLSGTAWAVGYAGGLVALIVMIGLVSASPESGRTLLGLQPIIALDIASNEADRLSGPFSALWYALFVIPFFLYTPDRPTGTQPSIRAGLAAVGTTVREVVGRYRPIAIFLLARMLYIDGLLAIFSFGGIYGAATFAWSPVELGVFGILLALAGTIGAYAGGFLDDAFGPARVIATCLVVLMAAAIAIVSIDANHIGFVIAVEGPQPGDGILASLPERVFLALGAIIGIVAGPMQSSSRTLLARAAPAERMAQFFGLFAFSGKITAFLAPLAVGIVTDVSGDRRLGIATIIVFLMLGLVVLLFSGLGRSAHAERVGSGP
ncbi:MAG: MFS transporter [Rhizobiales bacterium]|nr:MFS transporter [Hyphomicrobiales bacterium]